MKKLFSILMLCMFMFACNGKQGTFVPNYPVKDYIKPMYISSVTVLSAYGLGSGTIIYNKKDDRMIVLTAAHVVVNSAGRAEKEGKKIKFLIALGYNNKVYEARVIKTNIATDLAILESIDKMKFNGPFAPVAKQIPLIGEQLITIGAPLGHRLTVTSGILSNYKIVTRLNKKVLMFRITTDMFFGNSGGGVFNSKGELIGVAHGIQSVNYIINVPGGYFAIGLPHIRNIM